jgi:zinc transport system permease protein
METWLDDRIYDFCQLFPPQTLLSFPFNLKATLALIFISIICGAVGSLVVGNRLAFFSDALAHSAFAGVAIGILTAIVLRLPHGQLFDWIIPVMIVFGIAVGLGIVFVHEKTAQSSDTVIGVFYAGCTGLGAILLKIGNAVISFPTDEFLFGSLAGVKSRDLLILFGLLAATAGLMAWMYNGLIFASFNTSLARSRQVPLRFYNYSFIVLLAVIVNLCLSAVGALLINALLVVPAATAANLSRNLRQMFRWSIGLCLATCLAGQWLSWEVAIPANGAEAHLGEGGTIVVLNVLLFFASMVVGPSLKR